MIKETTTPNMAPVIAIDGPSASGKGTIAKMAAQRLGFHYLDSGLLYRLLALAATRSRMQFDAEQPLIQLANQMDIRFDGDSIWLSGEAITEEVRSECCGDAASKIAVLPGVRQALLAKQRDFRQPPGLVADGRDMGSVVFPDAVLKIFLTATAPVRAERRYKQLMEKGLYANLASILRDIEQRDERDRQRGIAPLQKVADATMLDTSNLTIEQTVDEVIARYQVLVNSDRVS